MLNPRLSVTPEELADFSRRWKVTELALFGSVLRADFRADSDVDVLVTFEPDAQWSLFDLTTMQQELADTFGRLSISLRKRVAQSLQTAGDSSRESDALCA